MNDYYSIDEILEQEEVIRAYEWSYTLTATLPIDSPSVGDLWMKAQEWIDNLLQHDSDALYCIAVCINKDSESKRPHLHGLVKTIRKETIVKACFTKNTKVKRYTPAVVPGVPPDFIRYTTEQAIRDTYLQNMEMSYAKTED